MKAGLAPSMELLALWKGRAATLARALLLALMGLGTFMLPAIGSAQSSIQVWQQAIKQTQPPGQGCFQASYPSTQWQQVFCAQPQNTAPPSPPPAGLAKTMQQNTAEGPIGGYGYSANSVGGLIRKAEGSFLSVTGVTRIIDSLYVENNYSLQINTNNWFNISGGSNICNNNMGCSGWVQFVYGNWNLPNVPNAAYISIWYWIKDAKSCPQQWTPWKNSNYDTWCYKSEIYNIPVQPLSSFNDQMILSGQTANGVDTAQIIIGGNAYSKTSATIFNEFPSKWQAAQFNVFGIGNLAAVNFSNGASLIINTKIDNGTTNAPTCSKDVGTGELNNLYYNSDCYTYAGGKPSIVFAEGTDNNPYKFSYAALGKNTITPVVTPAGSGTIAPSVPLEVPNRAISAFTVTPSANYKISSVTGCGGSLSGNVFTTAPATSSCTVTATFVSTAAAYTITASAGTGGTISPPGSITGVTSGTTRTFTLAPYANYLVSSVSGTCGGTLIGNTFTTNAITSNCTVIANFIPISGVEIPAARISNAISNTADMRYALDGNLDTFWNSLNYPQPTWIDVDLGKEYVIDTVYLNPNQLPNGQTTHNIYGRTQTDEWFFFGRIQQYTANGRWFYQSYPNQSKPVRYVIVQTTDAAGSWVAWREIKVTARAIQPVTYTITASAGTGGTISPPGSITGVVSGTTRSFTLTPNANYQVSSVTGSCGGTRSGNTFTTSPVTSNCTVVANFTQSTPSEIAIPNAKINGAISNTADMRYAMDGRTDTFWNSLGYPQPTWIDIDLGKEYLVHTVYLNPNQLPNGLSMHDIYGRTQAGEWVFFGTIQQYTADGQWFSQSYLNQNKLVRYVMIMTRYAAGSWVAWREIRITARN